MAFVDELYKYKKIAILCKDILLVLNAIRNLLIERQQPQAKHDLVLHLILRARRIQRSVQVLDERAHSVELVERQSVVVDAEEHLHAATQRVLERIL